MLFSSFSFRTNYSNIQIGQGDLALGQREYYLNETKITAAYRQLIGDLARTLSNDTSTVDQDVADVFQFEKQMAIVRTRTLNCMPSNLIALVSLDDG